MPTQEEWADEARAILSALIEREKLTYKSLAKLLAQRGIPCTPRGVKEKLLRGSYQFTFFMQVLVALGVEPGEITIELTLPPPTDERLKQSDRVSLPAMERRKQTRLAAHRRRKAGIAQG